LPRVTVHHLTAPVRLPMIEEEGLRTRADLSGLLGPIGPLDVAAPGTFAHGKRVSGYASLDHARTHVDEHGAGLVSYSVDPAKTLAAPASAREGDPHAYWEAARPLADWQADGELPEDLEVHVNVGVRAKFLHLRAPLFRDEDLGDFAPLVAVVADEDRLSAKALMHLAIIASEGDFETPSFNAACALAWRDEPDPDRLTRELVELDPDKIASAALAEFGTDAPEATARLREVLEETREWSDENGMTASKGVLTRTALILNDLPAA
jgi:hypothetical protein